jgi:hypothetical protein
MLRKRMRRRLTTRGGAAGAAVAGSGVQVPEIHRRSGDSHRAWAHRRCRRPGAAAGAGGTAGPGRGYRPAWPSEGMLKTRRASATGRSWPSEGELTTTGAGRPAGRMTIVTDPPLSNSIA